MNIDKEKFPLYYAMLTDHDREFVISASKLISSFMSEGRNMNAEEISFFIEKTNLLYLIKPSLINLLVNCPSFREMHKTCESLADLIAQSGFLKATVNESLSIEISSVVSYVIQAEVLRRAESLVADKSSHTTTNEQFEN